MKITAQNLGKEWDNIKGKLPKELVKIGEDSFIPFIKMLDDFDEDMMKDLELFIEKVNKFTDKEDEPKPQPKPEPKAKPKKDSKPKTEKKPKQESEHKPEPKAKPKKDSKPKTENKPKKEPMKKIGETPDWLSTVQSFVKSFAGKTKDTWRVRKFVKDIQAYFNSKHGKKTPNVEIIREIQEKLLPLANSNKAKVEVQQYADLVAKCKKAIKDKDFSVSKKEKKPELKKENLSGFNYGFSGIKFSNR